MTISVWVLCIFCLAQVSLAGTYNWVTSGSTNNSQNLAMSADGKNQAYEVFDGSKWKVYYASNLYTSRTASNTLTQSFSPSYFTKGNPSDIWIAFWGAKFGTGNTGLYNFKFGDAAPVVVVGLPAANTNYPVIKSDGTVVAYMIGTTNQVTIGSTLITPTAASYLTTNSAGTYIAFKGTDNNVYVYSNTASQLYSQAVTGGATTDKPAVSANGSYLACQTATDLVTLFNLNDGTQVRTFAGNAPVALSADGTLLACASTITDGNKANTYLYKTDGTKVRSISGTAASELAVSTTGPRIGMVSSAVLAGNSGAHSDVFTWDYALPTMSFANTSYTAIAGVAIPDVAIVITNPDSNVDSISFTATKKSGTLTLPVSITTTGATRTMSITNGKTAGDEIITVTATDGITTLTQDYTVTVNKATPAITGVTSSQAITYGAASIALSGTVSAPNGVYPAAGEKVQVTINGTTQDATVSGITGAFAINFTTPTIPASGTPYTITYAYAGDVNMTAAANDTSTTLIVNTKALTVTASNRSKTYGDAVIFAGTEFTTAGLINSDGVTTVTLTSGGAGATATVNTYSITPSLATGSGLSNYNISYATGTLTIGVKALTVTASNRSKTYGDAVIFAGTEFNTSGLTNSDTVAGVTLSSTGAAATATVTTYDINASAATGTGLSNYNINYTRGTLTVGTRNLTITANNTSKTYGNTVTFAGNEFTPGAGQLVNGDTITSVSMASDGTITTATVGDYGINVSGAQSAKLAYYNISYASGKLTVGTKALTITANNTSKTYGDTVTFAGTEFTTGAGQLINSDAVASVTLDSTGAGASAAVNTYTITPSAVVGTGLSNYNISYATGTLTVNAKALTITADNTSKTYGDTVTFAGTEFTTKGLINDNTVTGATLASDGAAATATVRTYAIIPSDATGSGLDNYAITYNNGTLTVGPKALTITANGAYKVSGDTITFAGTEFTTSTELINGDTVDSVALVSTGTAASAAIGSYAINASNATGTGVSNYDIIYITGTLKVIGSDYFVITAIKSSGDFGANITTVNAGELRGIELQGINFKPGISVELRQAGQPTIAGSFINVDSPTSITCDFFFTCNSPGNWDLYVANGNYNSTLAGAVTLTADAPTVMWITSTTVERNKIMTGNILGHGFINGASVTLKKAGQAGIPLPQSYITYWGNNRLAVAGLIPGGTPAGDYQVIVTNPDLQYSVDNVMLKITAGTPPTITSVSPVNQQNNQTACPLTINGTGFSGTPTVKLGSTITATNVVVVSNTQLTCTVNIDGVNTGCYDITVTNPDNGAATLQRAFTVVSPILTGVSLTADPVAPTVAGSTIKISAISTFNAAYGIDYEYHVRYYNTAFQIWVDNILAGFTPDTDYQWTPTEALNYYLYVIAKVRGTGIQVVSAELNYPITVPTLTSVYLQFTTKSANTVELKAIKNGKATDVEYYFYGYKKIGTEWTSFTIRTYDGIPGNDTVLWTVPAPDTYRFVVLARTIGSTSAYQVASPIFYWSY